MSLREKIQGSEVELLTPLSFPRKSRAQTMPYVFQVTNYILRRTSRELFQTKYCQCDLTAVLKTVKKEGPNQGKQYWSCPNSQAAACNFFEWESEELGGAVPLGSRTQSAGSQQTGECFNVSTP